MAISVLEETHACRIENLGKRAGERWHGFGKTAFAPTFSIVFKHNPYGQGVGTFIASRATISTTLELVYFEAGTRKAVRAPVSQRMPSSFFSPSVTKDAGIPLPYGRAQTMIVFHRVDATYRIQLVAPKSGAFYVSFMKGDTELVRTWVSEMTPDFESVVPVNKIAGWDGIRISAARI